MVYFFKQSLGQSCYSNYNLKKIKIKNNNSQHWLDSSNVPGFIVSKEIKLGRVTVNILETNKDSGLCERREDWSCNNYGNHWLAL